MTPKEKSIELVKKFEDLVMFDYRGDEEPIFELQKQCALIAVDEVLSYIDRINKIIPQDLLAGRWQEVKSEIEKL